MAGALVAEDIPTRSAVVLTTQHGELSLAALALTNLIVRCPHNCSGHHVCLVEMAHGEHSN